MSKKNKIDKNYLLLMLGVIFLFIILNVIHNNHSMYIDLYGNRHKANDAILIKEDNEYYISYSYVKENIDKEIYFDDISKKIVISSEKGLIKARVDDKKVAINFENNQINCVGVIEKEDKYISLEILEKAYDFDINVYSNTIYISSSNSVKGKIKNSHISAYVSNDIKSSIKFYVDKKDKIDVVSEHDNFVFVKVNNEKIGYIPKKLVSYKIINKEQEKVNDEKKVYFFADYSSKISIDLPNNGIIVDMFNITQTSTAINEKNINYKLLENIKKYGYDLYGKIDNGYDLSMFNTSTTSTILSDETKRLNLINNLNDKIKKYNLNGIVVDFRAIKEKDIDGYIQLIKEMKSFCKIEIIVNVNASEYKKYLEIINYSDFAIINAYGQRDLKSTVSGSVSEINWMKNIINDSLKKADKQNIVIGIPAYSILWTEKNSNVINAEIYTLNLVDEYISKNNLDKKQVNGQNYVELKKGSLLYRMWIEDEKSLTTRLDIIKKNNLKGVAIYKLGYENKSLIDTLKKF